MAQPRWIVEVVVATNTAWDIDSDSETQMGCPQCKTFVDAALNVSRVLPKLLSAAAAQTPLATGESDDDANDHVLTLQHVTVDCRDIDGSTQNGFPCGERMAFPALRLRVREGSTTLINDVFKGVGDALGIATWIQSRLPRSYGVSKMSVSSLFTPQKGRSMLRGVGWSTTSVAAKEVAPFVKANPEALVVVLATAVPCRRCSAWHLVFDAVHRILNATGLKKDRAAFFTTPLEDSVWLQRWLGTGSLSNPTPVQCPVVLLFLPSILTDGRPQPIPLTFTDTPTVENLLAAVNFWIPADARIVEPSTSYSLMSTALSASKVVVDAANRVAVGDVAPHHLLTTQLRGLKQSNVSKGIEVVVNDDVASLNRSCEMPKELDRLDFVEAGLEEEDTHARHVFVTLLVSSWFAPAVSEVMKNVNHFLAYARQYDQTNNAATATFTVVDLHTVSYHPGSRFHDVYLGGDHSISLGEVCLSPPCLLSCTQFRARRGSLRCGGASGSPFNRLTLSSIDFDALDRAVAFAVEPQGDDETNLKPMDSLSKALTASPFVHHGDSLRPWFVADKNTPLGRGSSEGQRSAASGALLGRRAVVVLFHGADDTSATGIHYSRTCLLNFASVCKALNSSVGTVTTSLGRTHIAGGSSVMCAAIDAHQHQQLALKVRQTLQRAASEGLKQSVLAHDARQPFIAVFSTVDGSEVTASSGESLDASLLRQSVLDVTPEMLMLRPQAARDAILAAIGAPAAPAPSNLVWLSPNKVKATVTDPARASLLLFSGGAGCPHSQTLLSVFHEVAEAFVNERREVTIGVVDAAQGLDPEERSAVYNVHQLPFIVWYPKGMGKRADAGHAYRGVTQKLPLIEFVNDEMGYAFHEMDWLKDSTIPAVTRRDWVEKISGPAASNRSSAVVFVYRDIKAEMKTLEKLVELQQKFDSHPIFAAAPSTPSEDAADVLQAPHVDAATKRTLGGNAGAVDFFKMDGRRFEAFLETLGLLKKSDGKQIAVLPQVIFLPRGPMKVEHAVSAVLASNDVISVAQFVLGECRKNTHVSKDTGAAALDTFSFDEDDIEVYRAAIADKSNLQTSRRAVRSLDTQQFRAFVDDATDAVVFFYATWCTHSTAFAPYFDEVAEYFRYDDTIQFAKVDVPKEDEVGHGQGILSFPTVKMYFYGSSGKGTMVGSEYPHMAQFLDRPVNPNATTNFIQYLETTRRTSRVAELDHERELREHSLLELNETSLKDFVVNGTDQLLVEFYAPWCGHCRTVIPELQVVGEHFRRIRRTHPSRPRLTIARLDATKFRQVATLYNATTYPTILLFTNELQGSASRARIVRKVHRYSDHRLADRIAQFVTERLPSVGTHTTTETSQTATEEVESREHNELRPPVLSGVQHKGEPAVASQGSQSSQQATRAPAATKTNKQKIEDLYTTDRDLKEVIRKRNLKKSSASQIKTIERSRTLSRNVRFLTEDSLRGLLDTTTVVAVLHCEQNVDEEHIDAWSIVADTLSPFIEKKLVVVGILEASDATTASKTILGEAPSITVFRGLATPSVARYHMLDPYEDRDEFSKLRAGSGGSGTNATEVLEFVRRQVHSSLISSAELRNAKEFEHVTQNMSARVLVFLYAPWSKESQQLAPAYDALAQQYLHKRNWFVTRVDVSKNTKLYERLHRAQLPLILCYDDVEGRPDVDASVRKIPRRLLTRAPSRRQMAAFFSNEEGDAHVVLQQDYHFVPFGDEDATVATSQQPSRAPTASQPVMEGAPAASVAAESKKPQHSSPVYPNELSTFAAFDEFVKRQASSNGALVFFTTSWCKNCHTAQSVFVTAANALSSDIAVAIFNAATTEDATALKRSSYAISHFPATMLYFVNGDGDGTQKILSAEHKARGHDASPASLIKFAFDSLIAAARSRAVPLPAYETQGARLARATSTPSEARQQTASPAATKLDQRTLPVVRTADDAEQLFRRYQKVVESGAVPVLVALIRASWCTTEQCRDVSHAHAIVEWTTSRRANTVGMHSDIQASVVDVSNKAVKQMAKSILHSVSVPSIVVLCNGSAHRFFDTARDVPESTVQRLSSFVDEACLDVTPLDVLRRRYADAIVIEGDVTDMSYDSILGSTETASIFAILYHGAKCEVSPMCLEGMKIMRRISGAHRNRQLLFVKVDMSREENIKHFTEDGSATTGDAAPGSRHQPLAPQFESQRVHFVYFPVEAPPVAYEGDLEQELIQRFVNEQDQISRDARRRV